MFPLYLYPETGLFEHEDDKPEPNISPAFVEHLQQTLRLSWVNEAAGDLVETVGPDDVLAYIYAVLYSPAYRDRYAEPLRQHFPHIPVADRLDLFRRLVSLGRRLIAVHTRQSPELANPITSYPLPGPNVVEQGYPRYVLPTALDAPPDAEPPSGCVYINDHPIGNERGQRFVGIAQEVWEFQIGGQQVCERWLEDRRGRALTFDELSHYGWIVTSIAETIHLMDEIDEVIPDWPALIPSSLEEGQP